MVMGMVAIFAWSTQSISRQLSSSLQNHRKQFSISGQNHSVIS